MIDTPYLSRANVGAALDALIYTSAEHEVGALRNLLLVDLLVNAPDMPSSDEAREYAVRELLVSEIADALNTHRFMFQLKPVDLSAPSHDAIASLAEDVKVGTVDLLAWSVLYYRYVRSDLGITVERLAALEGVEPRTIGRYRRVGIRMLTNRLIKAERQARQAQLQRRLYGALPFTDPVSLFGRDKLLDEIENFLPSLAPCHLVITGVAGIGKSMFVQEFLRRLIDKEQLDHIVWINQPKSVRFVREQLSERLLHEGGEVTLREYLQLYRVAVVLDGIDAVALERQMFADLLRDLGAALVCLTNRAYVPLESVEAHLTLPALTRQDAEMLLDHALHTNRSARREHWREAAPDLYERVGGNPLAIKLAAGDDASGWAAAASEVGEYLFGESFAALKIEEQQAWCALSLFPRAARLDELTALWRIPPKWVNALLRRYLVEWSGEDAYSLAGAAREYARRQYEVSDDVRRLFDTLIETIQPGEAALDVLEEVLMSGFPALDLSRRAALITEWRQEGMGRGNWARWRAIFEAYIREAATVEPELRIAYGVCLRRLADWNGAWEVFYNVVAETGHTGRFGEQARALVEWSILARYQGDYERALRLVEQAKRYAQRTHAADLLHLLTLQEAQILIQRGRAEEAYRLLVASAETQHVLTLQSEALFALGKYDACRALAQRGLGLAGNDRTTVASLNTIIGRSYQQQGDFEQAHRHFTEAVMLLERLDDAFALARAQTNLAAVLIPMERHLDAGTLLARAEQVQLRLGDKVGLSATRHNRAMLGIAR